MPPFLPRRGRSRTPQASSSTPKPKAKPAAKTSSKGNSSKKSTPKKKPTLFDAADSSTKPARSLSENQQFVDSLNNSNSSSSLSSDDVSSGDFEDVPLATKKAKLSHQHNEDSEEEDVEWEDALQPAAGSSVGGEQTPLTPAPTGDLELTLTKGMSMGTLTDPHASKKGPTKIERQIRVDTHCMHVQLLMWHNWVRNKWAGDGEVQEILVGKLGEVQKKAVEDWRRRSGQGEVGGKSKAKAKVGTKAGTKAGVKETPKVMGNGKGRGRGRPKKSEEKEDTKESSKDDTRNQRDWGNPAVRLEEGKADLSRGDPIIKLLQILAAWWKRSFRISAPGLRKIGYKPISEIQEEITSFQNDKHNPEEHGEKIDRLKGFRDCARTMEGSRDIGGQLFTALLRGLGIEARLVASLQPTGFGWNKAEEAHPKKEKAEPESASDSDSGLEDEEEGGFLPEVKPKKDIAKVPPRKIAKTPQKTPQKANPKQSSKKTPARSSARKQPGRGAKGAPIELSDDSSELSDPPEASESEESVIDVAPAKTTRKPNARYDRDMTVPNYWTEVVASASLQIIPVDATVNQKVIIRDEDKFTAFEPRGKRAENAKQVFAYVVAFSPDGTAKDVTTRYLKRHMWPGKTKGVRMPIEKIPVYNRAGKVKRYFEYDWFKTVVLGNYAKSHHFRPPIDDVEDNTDLKVVKPEKRTVPEGQETLQYYKQSTEYVLKRHLRREEALLPHADPVKQFTHGKGDKAVTDPVYLRKDVVACKTAESWHKEGREIQAGAQALKWVPVRAVTMTRKLEIQQAERESGEKATQGLYSKEQTQYIIPPPIEDGVIPKNAYGNIDCFVPSMVPRGAVHFPHRGCGRICKKLGIDYAEAVVGFEFGNKMAVPVIQGVVVAEENEGVLTDAYIKDKEEKERKEDEKRRKVALGTWRKLLMGLRIVERVREEYGAEADEGKDEINPFTNRKALHKTEPRKSVPDVEIEDAVNDDEDMAGGFVVEDGEKGDEDMAGGFVLEDEDN